MIHVTRLNHSSLVLNNDLIEHIEVTPDTVITMTTGQRFTVLQTPDEIVDLVRAYRHSLLIPDHLSADSPKLREVSRQLPVVAEAHDGF